MERCCGTCIYHEYDDDIDYRCVCKNSDGYGEYTMFQDYCGCWQGKNEMQKRNTGR